MDTADAASLLAALALFEARRLEADLEALEAIRRRRREVDDLVAELELELRATLDSVDG